MKFRLFSLFTICAIVSLASPIREAAALRGTDFSGSSSETTMIQVEYLESTGNEYIDIGIIPESPRDAFDIGLMKVGHKSNAAFCGCMDGYGSNDFGIRDGWYAGYYGIATANRVVVQQSVATENLYAEWHMAADDRHCLWNGKLISNTSKVTEAKTYSASFLLFKGSGTGRNHGPVIARIYFFRYYRGGELVRDFVPVRFKNEQHIWEGGMYDRISGEIFCNHGSGAFLIGPDAEGEE